MQDNEETQAEDSLSEINAPLELDNELDSTPDIDWLARADAAYTASTDYFDANVRSELEGALRQFNSEHPIGSKYLSEAYRGRARGFRPKTRSAVTKYEATAAEALFSSYDVVDVQALDKDDPLQVESATFAKHLLQIRLTTSIPWFMIAMGAFQDATVAGIVVSKQSWMYNEPKRVDRPDVELVPVENFRFDPAASWIDPVNSSPYLVHLIPLHIKDVKERIRTGAWLPVAESELQASASRQLDSIRSARTGDRAEATDNTISVTDYSIVWIHENIVEEEGQDWLFYTLGTTVLLSDPVPLEHKYPQGRPFVVGFSVVEPHKVYPSGLPKLTKDTQAEANDLANLRRDNINFVLNKRYFVKRGKQVDLRSLTRNVPGSATLMDNPEEDVKIAETADVTSSSYQEQDRLNLDFDEVAGVFSGSSVQSNRRMNETVGGMNILTSNADKVTNYRLRTFVESWVEPVLRQVLLLEKHFETDSVLMRRAALQAELPQELAHPEVLYALLEGDVMLNVNVGMSATNPTEKINMLMTAMRAIKEALADGTLMRFGLDAGELIKEVFAGIGYRDGSRFFGRAEDPTVQALQGQIEELQQALNAKVSPELLAAQVGKLTAETERVLAEKVQTGVQAAYAAMQAGQVIAAAPAVAPIADEIMAGAGYQDAGGADPNFPQPTGAAPGLVQGDIRNRRTGIEFNPTGQPNTNPMTAPSPNVGQAAGIETQRNDGVL
jgi:hypothetical protein